MTPTSTTFRDALPVASYSPLARPVKAGRMVRPAFGSEVVDNSRLEKIENLKEPPASAYPMRLRDYWKPLHELGYKGQGIKIAVVDYQFPFSVHDLQDGKVSVLNPFPTMDTIGILATPAAEKFSHGSSIVRMLRDALPESEIIGVDLNLLSLISDFMEKSLILLLEKQERQLEQIAPEEILNGIKPFITRAIDTVNIALNQGVTAINLSYRPDLVFLTNNLSTVAEEHFERRLSELGGIKIVAKAEKEAFQTQSVLWLMSSLFALNADEWKALLLKIFPEWFAALDRAYQMGIPVFLSAGNTGTDNIKNISKSGNVDLLGFVEHPALLKVGSANAQGQISEFSSECHDGSPPFIAANGSGQWEIPNTDMRPLWKRLWSEGLRGLVANSLDKPSGTSYASPELLSGFAMMKCVKPSLIIEQAKNAWNSTAKAVTMPNEESTPSALKRRAGCGKVQHYEAIRKLLKTSDKIA